MAYSVFPVKNNMLAILCNDFGIEHDHLSEILRMNNAVMMGSATVSCIINENITSHMNIYVETPDDFVRVNDFILMYNYMYAYNEDFDFIGVKDRLQAYGETIQLYTYKLAGAFTDQYINILMCENIENLRKCMDVAASQCAYDGIEFTVPNEQYKYFMNGYRITWIRFPENELSCYEKYNSRSLYEYNDFTFIENPEAVFGTDTLPEDADMENLITHMEMYQI